MASDWYDYMVESEWTPTDLAGAARYALTLTNNGQAPLTGFRLGFSGPARVSDEASIDGGHVVTRLSNYCELAPSSGLVLAPGQSWTVTIGRLDYPLRHWTDGATTAFVVTSDGKAHPALTHPPRNLAVTVPRKRGTMALPLAGAPAAPYAIIPWPNGVAAHGQRTAPAGFAIAAAPGEPQAAADAFADLVAHLFPGEGLVRSIEQGGYRVSLVLEPGFSPEAYAADFAAEAATIRASARTGLLYGLVTLGQMARGARLYPGRFVFPTGGTIADQPDLGWRGCHLDVARRFYGPGEIAQFLRTLAWNKLNRFHWHLSDDEAWRVEIDAFPELTGKAAWRGHGLAIPPLLGSGPERSGGYYSKKDIGALVAMADSMGIAVIPEIDMPGHCYAMLSALPALRDPGENGAYSSIQSFENNCLNPAVEAVYAAVETILGEMVALFPSPWFHIGADEVPHDAWSSSPRARALLTEIGGTQASHLQAHFLKRVQALLTAHGKITGAWEEAAEGGGIDKHDCYLVGWRDVAANQRLANAGYDVVVSPGQCYYLDMANGPDWSEPGAGWAGWSSPEETYRFVPDKGWSTLERNRLLGIQGAIWSEPMSDRGVFDRLVYPRLSAIAETGWTRPENKSWERFSAAAGLMPNLYGVRE